MPSLPVYNLKKEKVGTIDLSDEVFAAEVKPHLLNEAVRTQIAKRYEYRTANSLTRSEVHGTTKKMYKQKGTGQARHGAQTAPIFVGGGKAHGPKPRRVRHSMNKKARRAAAIGALSMVQKDDRLLVIDKLELDKISTKTAFGCLKTLDLKKALFVSTNEGDKESAFSTSLRNIPGVKVISPKGVNVFDLLKYETLVLSQKSAQQLTERFSHE